MGWGIKRSSPSVKPGHAMMWLVCVSVSGGSGVLLLGLESLAAANDPQGNAGESGESVSGRLRHGVDGDVEAVEAWSICRVDIVRPSGGS